MESLCCAKRRGSERHSKIGVYNWDLNNTNSCLRFLPASVILRFSDTFCFAWAVPPSLTRPVMQALGTGPAGRLIINLENEPEMKSELILFVGFPKVIFISSQRLPQRTPFKHCWALHNSSGQKHVQSFFCSKRVRVTVSAGPQGWIKKWMVPTKKGHEKVCTLTGSQAEFWVTLLKILEDFHTLRESVEVTGTKPVLLEKNRHFYVFEVQHRFGDIHVTQSENWSSKALTDCPAHLISKK